MAFHIRDPETDRIVRELARKMKAGLTEAVKVAARNELAREGQRVPLAQRLGKITARVARQADKNVKLNKAFFDELSGN
jgi:antitoxin VapB